MALLVAAACGCGNGMEKLGGKITVGGEGPPADLGGAVTLFPKSGPPAVSQIKPDGTFDLKTGSSDGLKPGVYQVGIGTWFGDLPMTPSPTHPSWTHKKYSDRKTSGLEITIPLEGNYVEWDLDGDDGRPVR